MPLLLLKSNIHKWKKHELTIYLEEEGLAISTPRGWAFYDLLLHDHTKLFLLKCGIWLINCQKLPQAKWADVCNCLGGRVCVCVCKIGKEKKRKWQMKEEEESLLGSGRKVSPVWACFGMQLLANVLFKGLFIHPCDELSFQFWTSMQFNILAIIRQIRANHLFFSL